MAVSKFSVIDRNQRAQRTTEYTKSEGGRMLMLKKVKMSNCEPCNVTASIARPAWSLIFGLAAVGTFALTSEAHANAPNFLMLLGPSPYMIATVPVTIAIESAAIRWLFKVTWSRSILISCINYIASTIFGSYIGGGISFAIHPIFFETSHTFYLLVNTILYSTINTAIEALFLVVVFRLSMRWLRFGGFYAANLITTGLLFIH